MNRGEPPSYPEELDDYDRQPPPVRPAFNPPAPSAPLVTYTILGITLTVFLLQIVSQFSMGGDLPQAIGMKINSRIIAGEYWRLLTPMLLHGSFLHIAFNMYALFIFGPGLERHFGRLRFLLLYLLSGFAGNVISFTFTPANSLGSSTAVFGLIGAQGVFLFLNREIFSGSARAALGQIVMIAAVNLFIGLSPGIDNWGHIGGLIGGILFTFLAGPLLTVQGTYPYLQVRDTREGRSVVMAALGVALFFLVIAALIIRDRGG
jgi:rhomboid protease GluP